MADAVKSQESEKRKRTRSPAYPYVNLDTALARAAAFHGKEQRQWANVNVAVQHWGFVKDSSGGLQTIAALIAFGLMEDEDTGDKRKVRLTDRALRILLDKRHESSERSALIKQAALSPKIHQELWEKYGANLPSDENLRHTLLFEWPVPFNENAVDFFISEYRSTIEFAKLLESDKDASEVENKGGERGGSYVPKAGDYVQWEPKGILQFKEPKRITSISADGTHAFVEGSATGLPVGELTLQGKPASVPPIGSPPVLSLPEKHAMRQDVFSVDEGTVTIQWPTPLSTASIQDVKEWLKIVERKITRSAQEKRNDAGTTEAGKV